MNVWLDTQNCSEHFHEITRMATNPSRLSRLTARDDYGAEVGVHVVVHADGERCEECEFMVGEDGDGKNLDRV